MHCPFPCFDSVTQNNSNNFYVLRCKFIKEKNYLKKKISAAARIAICSIAEKVSKSKYRRCLLQYFLYRKNSTELSILIAVFESLYIYIFALDKFCCSVNKRRLNLLLIKSISFYNRYYFCSIDTLFV